MLISDKRRDVSMSPFHVVEITVCAIFEFPAPPIGKSWIRACGGHVMEKGKLGTYQKGKWQLLLIREEKVHMSKKNGKLSEVNMTLLAPEKRDEKWHLWEWKWKRAPSRFSFWTRGGPGSYKKRERSSYNKGKSAIIKKEKFVWLILFFPSKVFICLVTMGPSYKLPYKLILQC